MAENDKQAQEEGAADVKAVTNQDKDAAKAAEARRKERDANVAPRYANTKVVVEGDLPSVEDKNVNLLQAPGVDAAEGWTVQSDVSLASPTSLPGQYVRPEELPTKEGLEAMGIDPVPYVANVPVFDAKAAKA